MLGSASQSATSLIHKFAYADSVHDGPSQCFEHCMGNDRDGLQCMKCADLHSAWTNRKLATGSAVLPGIHAPDEHDPEDPLSLPDADFVDLTGVDCALTGNRILCARRTFHEAKELCSAIGESCGAVVQESTIPGAGGDEYAHWWHLRDGTTSLRRTSGSQTCKIDSEGLGSPPVRPRSLIFPANAEYPAVESSIGPALSLLSLIWRYASTGTAITTAFLDRSHRNSYLHKSSDSASPYEPLVIAKMQKILQSTRCARGRPAGRKICKYTQIGASRSAKICKYTQIGASRVACK